MKHICYISIGSNLGDKLLNCKHAIQQLEYFSKILKKSSFYETQPWGYQDIADYINAVLKIETFLDLISLLNKLKMIEKKMGRISKKSGLVYESRIIDLDILFYDDIIINDKEITIPHPKLYYRNYVLEPFFEIDPNFKCPLKKKKISNIFKESKDNNKIQLYTH